MSPLLTIRRAEERDADAIAEIYNESIASSAATFDTQPKTVEDRQAWIARHGERHAVLVAETDGGLIAGWASLSEWSDRCAYADTVENSVYVRVGHRGHGTGRLLLAALIEAGRAAGLHTIVARIAGESAASIKLHEHAGFARIGTMREVGRKFDRFHDVHLYQLML